MKLVIVLLFSSMLAMAQNADLTNIRHVMHQQQLDWNNGSLEAFMQGYWNSDSLKFISSRGINYGWKATLAGYQQRYPSKKEMGTLTFTILSLEKLSSDSAFMIGKWHLKRSEDEPNGHFTLLWKKIKGHWVIVVDHTS
jgi:ketosteroid isomerase-like protein